MDWARGGGDNGEKDNMDHFIAIIIGTEIFLVLLAVILGIALLRAASVLSASLAADCEARFANRKTVEINSDYGGLDNLRYIDTDGTGISGNIFFRSDRTKQVVRGTVIRNDGRWGPINIPAGQYTAEFLQLQSETPDVIRLAV